MKYVPPSVRERSFNCPHCGVLTTQFWYATCANPHKENGTPLILTPADVQQMRFEKKGLNTEELMQLEHRERIIRAMASGLPGIREERQYVSHDVHNVSLSRCYSCGQVSIWLYQSLLWPGGHDAPVANPDLPQDIRKDYAEAAAILKLSARGAAALLRLCIQKLCIHLGLPGKNINDDIAALVKKGLDPRVQMALDVVRVVGNNAVHPGKMDLNDDIAIAEELFRLVNLVCEIMISQPKHIEEMYKKLPESARKAIEARDGRP